MNEAFRLSSQILSLTVASIKARYRRTWAGFVWVLLSPIVMFTVQSLVFKVFLKVEIPRYTQFLLSGLLPWIFIFQSLEVCTGALHAQSQLIKVFRIPAVAVIGSQVGDNFFNLITSFLIILLPIAAFNMSLTSILFLPVALFLLFAFVFKTSWLLSLCQTFFHDTRFIVSFGLHIAYFLTPIFYPASFIPTEFQWIRHANPLHWAIQPIQLIVADSPVSQIGFSLVRLTLINLVLFLISWTQSKKMMGKMFLRI